VTNGWILGVLTYLRHSRLSKGQRAYFSTGGPMAWRIPWI